MNVTASEILLKYVLMIMTTKLITPLELSLVGKDLAVKAKGKEERMLLSQMERKDEMSPEGQVD